MGFLNKLFRWGARNTPPESIETPLFDVDELKKSKKDPKYFYENFIEVIESEDIVEPEIDPNTVFIFDTVWCVTRKGRTHTGLI